MNPQIITAICLAVAAIISILSVTAILVYDKTLKKKKLGTEAENAWLFDHFQASIFDIFYKKQKGDSCCGISEREYNRFCQILHEKPDFKKMVAMRIEGVGIALVFIIIAYITSYSLISVAVCFFLAAAAIGLLWVMPYGALKNKADERLFRIRDDLPRYLSLLEKAMDLPIDQAMLVTSSKFKSPLSDDIIDSINKVSLGANGWTETLIDLAKIYQIEDFSDLMLEIVNSYEQGVNVRNLVNRKAYEVEQNRLYAVEAHDAKIKTLIFLPVIIFKVLPLMVLVCLPMMTNFAN